MPRLAGVARAFCVVTLAALVAQDRAAGCTDAGKELPAGDWLVVGENAEPVTLHCTRATDAAARKICRLVQDTLVDLDERRQLVPRLARSFTVAPDGLSITFRLRAGVTWHDGTPFGPRDVLHTVEMIRRIDPKGDLFRAYFGPMSEVTSPDAETVKASYTEPFSGAMAGWREMFIMPAHRPDGPDGRSPQERTPIGTGPFRFVQWDAQQQVVLAANLAYFGGRPCVDRYVHRIIPNAEALRLAAEAAEVDVAHLTTDWAAAHTPPDAALPFRVVTYPSTSVELVYWNMKEPRGLFRDARVRRALTMLLDREGYAGRIHHGLYRPLTTLIDPAIWGGDPALRPFPYDPAGAAKLLDEAGVVDRDGDGIREIGGRPMEFTLIYSGMAAQQREIAGLLERAAATAGLRVTLQPLEWPVMRQKLYGRQFEAAIHRWTLEPIPDPFVYFHSSQAATGYNFGGYHSEEYDRLCDTYRKTLDPARGAAILAQLQALLHRDQPCTFVATPSAVAAIHKRFRVPEVTPAGLWNWYPSMLAWWVPPEQRKHH